jgi:HSP20 family protein
MMNKLTRWGRRPSINNLRRDIDDALDEFTSPRALRREIDRLFGEDLSPRNIWQEMSGLFDEFVMPTQLRRRVSALFEPFGVGVGGGGGTMLGASRGGTMFVPELELVERDNELLLSVDLPGVRQEDVDVSVDEDNVLTIRGERRDEQSRRARGYEYTERSYGSFVRSVELPRGIDGSRIDAEYRDGVLQLHIPKSEQAMGRQIPIKSREYGREQSREQQGREQGGEQSRDQPRVMSPQNGGENAQRREGRTQNNVR